MLVAYLESAWVRANEIFDLLAVLEGYEGGHLSDRLVVSFVAPKCLVAGRMFSMSPLTARMPTSCEISCCSSTSIL